MPGKRMSKGKVAFAVGANYRSGRCVLKSSKDCHSLTFVEMFRGNPLVVRGGLLVARGMEKVWYNSLYSTTRSFLTTVWLPLCCPSALFQAA
jgi:hypothetical protein